jgi:hypothetical protein
LVRRFILPHALDFYASLATDRIDRTRDIAAWLLTTSPEQVRAADFKRFVHNCRGLSLGELNQALEPLVSGGWLEPETPYPTNRTWKLDVTVRTVPAQRIATAQARREEKRVMYERIRAGQAEG